MKKIAIIGLGYVGLPLAVEFGKKRQVVGFDVDPKRINELNSNIDATSETSVEDLQSASLLTYSSKINEIKDNYSALLKTESHYRDRMFLELIAKKLNSGDLEKDKDIFLSNITDEESNELDIIGYNSWVKEHI